MSALSISPPFPIFSDSDGTALENGYIWIGTTNLNPIVNPISVYWDAALTVAAVQPIRTLNGYPVYQGTPARLYVNSDYSIQVQNRNGSVVYSAPAATEAFGNLINASQVVYDPAGTGAVATTVQTKLRESVSVFDFMTAAQITAVQSYAFALDVTTPVQAAIDYSWVNGNKLMFPPGGYLVTGLSISETGAQAGRVLWMEGSGTGNPFTIGSANGTTLKCNMDNPVFTVNTSAPSTSTGTLKIRGISFYGNSTTAVVLLKGFYGTSEFWGNVVYQVGVGNGLEIQSMATGLIHECYFLNRDCVTFGLGAARVGVGLWLNQQYDAGLQTVTKCSSRGWLTAYKVGNGAGAAYTYSAAIRDSECSVNYNGIHLTANARATSVDTIYLEGGEGGSGIWDQGDYNRVTNCFSFSGYSTHLKSTDFTYGNYYAGNTFAAGTAANQVLIDITSSSVSGGPGKTCTGNFLSFGGSGGSIAGVIGVRINGTDPRLNLLGNNFFPRSSWVGGAGTTKISDLSAGGVFGMTTAIGGSGAQEIPMLSRGALSFEMADAGLSQFNVSGNTLTIPGGSLFYCNATTPVTVNRFSTDATAGRILIFNTQNANMTFANSAYVFMNGAASFASRGHIVFYTQILGGVTYAYELCRSTY